MLLDHTSATLERPAYFEALSIYFEYFAATTAQELVVSTVGRRVGLDRATAQHYASWLETVFLVHRVPAWSRNLTAKVIRRPKLYLTDTGVAGALLGKDAAAIQLAGVPAGPAR